MRPASLMVPSASLAWGLSVLLAMFATEGCSSESAESRVAKALKDANIPMPQLYPLGGTVTIDGKPPDGAGSVFVVLNDLSKPDEPVNQRTSTQCDDQGHFEFSTIKRGDGVNAGTYVITFAKLKGVGRSYGGPDQLKNLYSDPDKNAQDPNFKIDHKAPGKRDYVFDLKVEGKEAARPGKYSLLNSD